MSRHDVLCLEFDLLATSLHSCLDFVSDVKSHQLHLAEGYLQNALDLQKEFLSWKKEAVVYNSTITENEKEIPIQSNINHFNEYLALMRAKMSALKTETKSKECINTFSHSLPSNLESIALPVFSGFIPEFRSFIELFNELVHNNPAFSDIQKFLFLRSKLKGDALAVINDLEILASNYTLALNTLQEAFASQRVVATYYINELLNFNKNYPKASLQKFLDINKSCCNALSKLSHKNLSDLILFVLSYLNLNSNVRKEFDHVCTNDDNATTTNFFNFVNLRVKSEKINEICNRPIITDKSKSFISQETFNSCICCQKQPFHFLMYCDRYLKMNQKQRFYFVKNNDLCVICLRKNHNPCPSTKTCKHCNDSKHNSTLCRKLSSSTLTKGASNEEQKKTLSCFQNNKPTKKQILLATVRAYARNSFGQLVKLKGILDPGSQSALLTQTSLNKLGLSVTPVKGSVSGLGGIASPLRGSTQFTLYGTHSRAQANQDGLTVHANVVNSITSNLLTSDLPKKNFKNTFKHFLADPNFIKSEPIDFLLGAQEFCELLPTRQQRFIKGEPSLLLTKWGYVVMGEINSAPSVNEHTFLTTTTDPDNDIDFSLKQLFEVSESNETTNSKAIEEHVFVENHFLNNYKRRQDGSYVVKYPMKPEASPIGVNNLAVEKLFLRQEKHLSSKHPKVKENYDNFLQQYQNLGHMVPTSLTKGYILPHHAVFKTNAGSDNKIRVVFNASAKDNFGQSLNDKIYAGPTLHKDIPDILFKFRLKQVAISADVEKMFRGFYIHEDQQNLQQILWRRSPSDNLQCYRLTTVTYGINASPWLAMRCLQQLAADEKERYPLAAQVIQENFYVDDLVYSTDTIEEAVELKQQLIGIFQSANLTKKMVFFTF